MVLSGYGRSRRRLHCPHSLSPLALNCAQSGARPGQYRVHPRTHPRQPTHYAPNNPQSPPPRSALSCPSIASTFDHTSTCRQLTDRTRRQQRHRTTRHATKSDATYHYPTSRANPIAEAHRARIASAKRQLKPPGRSLHTSSQSPRHTRLSTASRRVENYH